MEQAIEDAKAPGRARPIPDQHANNNKVNKKHLSFQLSDGVKLWRSKELSLGLMTPNDQLMLTHCGVHRHHKHTPHREHANIDKMVTIPSRSRNGSRLVHHKRS
jgi:hypothetical protein